MIEIERKFLVKSEAFKKEAHSSSRIIQGFLNTDPERTVRVRVIGNEGIITVKGLSSDEGLKRFEWEKTIPKEEALSLLQLCEEGVIDKTRFFITLKNHTFEVDVFHNLNEGLIIAEVELNSISEKFPRPCWLGEEVTGTIKYYNSELSKNPYRNWSSMEQD